jgi:hypothetical protein
MYTKNLKEIGLSIEKYYWYCQYLVLAQSGLVVLDYSHHWLRGGGYVESSATTKPKPNASLTINSTQSNPQT